MQIFKFSDGVHRHFIAALFCVSAFFALSANLKSRHQAALRLEAATLASEDIASSGVKLRATMKALEIAARRGDIASGMEVARRYSAGLGVGKSDGQAFFFYRLITDRYSGIDRADGRSVQVVSAMRALAQLYRKGIPNARISSDPAAAVDLLRYAGSYFGDAAAQYDLATLILNGEGVSRNPRSAVQWLLNASRKGYAPAQALLGSLLWQGEGVQRAAGDGLGLLAVARHNVAPADRNWVNGLFEKAAAEATATELLEANAFIAQEASAQGWTLTDELLVRKPPPAPPGKSAAGDQNAKSSAAMPSSVNLLTDGIKTRLAGLEEAKTLRNGEIPNVAIAEAPNALGRPQQGVDFAAAAIPVAHGLEHSAVSPVTEGSTRQ